MIFFYSLCAFTMIQISNNHSLITSVFLHLTNIWIDVAVAGTDHAPVTCVSVIYRCQHDRK